MKIYKCDLCNKEFNKKCNYDQHISRKTPCNKNINLIINLDITKVSQKYHKDITKYNR